MRYPRVLLLLAAVLAGAASCSVRAAEGDVQVLVETDVTEVYVGENIAYQVTALNVTESITPDLGLDPAVWDIAGPNRMTFTHQVNTRLYQGVRYTYRLTPRKPGRLRLPGATITVKGKAYTSDPLAITANAPELQDWAQAEIVIEPKRVFPTQPFTVTLRVALQEVPGLEGRDPIKFVNPPSLRVPWFLEPPEGVEMRQRPDDLLREILQRKRFGFEMEGYTINRGPIDFGFGTRAAVVLPKSDRMQRTKLDGSKAFYFVYDFPLKFVAEHPGRVTFGPATLKGMLPTGATGNRLNTQRLMVVAEPATVDVVDLATLNAPADFSGAIGRFTIHATATPRRLRVGDPLEVKLEIKSEPGSGSLNLIEAPNLADQPQVVERFKVFDEKPIGEKSEEGKVFTYSLRPVAPGVDLPPITMTYFNPENEKFETVHTDPVKLDVEKADRVSSAEIVSAERRTQGVLDLKETEGGLRQNITDLAQLDDQRVDIRPYVALPAGLVLCYLALWSLVARRRRIEHDVAWQRRQGALKRCLERIASTEGEPAEAPGEIRAALLGLIADQVNLPAAGTTPRDADGALEAAAAGEDLRKELAGLLEAMEAQAYGAAVAAGDLAEIRKRAAALARRLHKVLSA